MTRALLLLFGPLVCCGASWFIVYSSSLPKLRITDWFSFEDELPIHEDFHDAQEWISHRLGSQFKFIDRSPFLLVGDCSQEELQTRFEESVEPLVQALTATYFTTPPTSPIVLVLASSESSFHFVAEKLDHQHPTEYFGYYQRNQRRVVVNLATGEGTLAHELTHALAHVDFPNMPEWFDEGLATLHEEAIIEGDGLTLQAIPNWRTQLAIKAVRQNALPSLEEIVEGKNLRGDREALNYALVRTLCLYLQERGLLSDYYNRLKANIEYDPTGGQTLCQITELKNLRQLDRAFRDWLGTLEQKNLQHSGSTRIIGQVPSTLKKVTVSRSRSETKPRVPSSRGETKRSVSPHAGEINRRRSDTNRRSR